MRPIFDLNDDAAIRHSDPGNRGHRRLSGPDVSVRESTKEGWKNRSKYAPPAKPPLHADATSLHMRIREGGGGLSGRVAIDVHAHNSYFERISNRVVMSRMSINTPQSLLSSMVPKHEYLLNEIESTDTNSIGLVFRYLKSKPCDLKTHMSKRKGTVMFDLLQSNLRWPRTSQVYGEAR